MARSLTGRWSPETLDGRDFDAFIPNDLPVDPPIVWTPLILKELSLATASVARLDGAAHSLPDVDLFLYSYVRKEAVLSSQIEGTQSSLSDLLLHESGITPGVPISDVDEVSRYVLALTYGIEQVREKLTIDADLIVKLHYHLLHSGRGSNKDPGKLRERQNWVGGKTPDNCKFVPPPPSYVENKLQNLFSYIEESNDPILIKAAIAHVQFETIHPFRDGNGRIGRLLITLILCHENLINQPLVYLSLYLRQYRDEYYNHLQKVRIHGDLESWLVFFLRGVSEVTNHAYDLTTQIRKIFDDDAHVIREHGERKTASLLQLFGIAKNSPVFTAAKAEKMLAQSLSKPTLYSAAKKLCQLGILTSTINEKGTRVFYYKKYLEMLYR